MHPDHGRYRGQVVLQLDQPDLVRGREGALADRGDHRDRDEVGTPERGRELRRLLAWSAGWQESRHRERGDQPGCDDDPAEFDGERADSPEDGVNAHPVIIWGGTCDPT